MFSKILIPTDGSVLGDIAALEGVEMAAKLGAEAVFIHVGREYAYTGFGNKLSSAHIEQYDAELKANGNKLLKQLEEAADKVGIKYSSVLRVSNHTALTIVSVAEETDCDLIFIGSNGCAGWDDVLIGSVSNKVLATAKIPVLIYRVNEGEVPADLPSFYETPFPA